jgi:glutathione synthase/RimK-type ligase-like ATP-grasp enzyme
MKIAIHHTKGTFSDRWIEYCERNDINWKKVDCYRNDIISQISDCDIIMWHFHQSNPKDILFAKQLLNALQITGKKIFPDFRTSWHFDDKLSQKYLLEAIGAPMPKSWIFFDKQEALKWVENTDFPKVLKLRGGAGSQNVSLVETRNKCKRLINKAFTRGFPVYNALGSLKERFRKYRLGKTNFQDVLEGIVRFVIPPPYAKIRGREKEYIYLQEFIKGNDYDIRVVVIGEKAFAIKRLVRENDFRASGSGKILYDKNLIDKQTIILSFELADKLESQCVAFDFIYKNGKPLVVEISYGFSPEGYDPCPGYWDKNMVWYEGNFNPYGWMIKDLLNNINSRKDN